MEQKVFTKNQPNDLKSIIGKVSTEKILLVRGGESFQKSGAETFILELCQQKSLESFTDFEINPQLEDVIKGIALFKSGNFNQIIAIGGGSVLDMAKLISIFAHQSGDFKSIVEGKLPLTRNKTPLLAIPTTAGSGAEATAFAVVYIGKQKYSVAHEFMLPDMVYLDASFSLTAGKYITACTGLDALCQSIESVWSVNAMEQSQVFALQAIRLIIENLENAVLVNDAVAKENMQQAAYLAGKAINITKTTAPHALSYTFTSYYGIPHGHAVALSLPFFLHFNYHLDHNNCTDSRGADAVKSRIDKMLEIIGGDIFYAKQKLLQLFGKIGININIASLISDFDPELIIENVNVERLKNNPRLVSKGDIASFLKI